MPNDVLTWKGKPIVMDEHCAATLRYMNILPGTVIPYTGIPPIIIHNPKPPRCAYCGLKYSEKDIRCDGCGAPL